MPRILVIDDNETVRSTLCFLLRQAGFDVDEACNGQMGLEQAHRSLPDLILCDLTMPVMDGFETISRVRSDAVLQRIPIIVISGSVSEADESRAKSLGANSFIGKPFSLQPLMNLVVAELRASKPEPSAAAAIAGIIR
jgi:CheY-like chemotaxis protein